MPACARPHGAARQRRGRQCFLYVGYPFGRVAAVEYARHGVRINTVLPGQLHTPLVDAFLATQQAAGDVQALLDKRQKRIPLPFMGDGRDTANAVLFLVSDEARFITGTELIVDGGMSARCD
ncbi:hypothetical protein G6F54_014016 [Rhizopus delemar]|nr:hypothetical protein G6F54_014016 [Rhizopus delemar]